MNKRAFQFVLVSILLTAINSRGYILIQNSPNFDEADSYFNAWLKDVGITKDQIEYKVDFETGFSEGQNVSGKPNLFPGGLIITDTSDSHRAVVRSSKKHFGNSNPVGKFSLQHNQSPYLQLDFSHRPVDYVSFRDIDQPHADVFIDFTDDSRITIPIEKTLPDGNSAEFVGIYRNDMPRINKIRIFVGKKEQWGIDNICYGRLKNRSNDKDNSPPKLFIIAPERFHSTLEKYIQHKQEQLPTELISLEKVLKETKGVDDPERLKRFFYDHWKNNNLRYVLLVGDGDCFPVRYTASRRIPPEAYNFGFVASDLYYSDLAKKDGSFDDWNAQKDSYHAIYFGEIRGEEYENDPMNYDSIDYIPDIAVGRWPVSSPEEVRLVAAKTMRYEKGVIEKKPYLRRVGLIDGDWFDSRRLLNRLALTLPSGWTPEKSYFHDKEKATPASSKKHILRLLYDGVGLICHIGHGGGTSWSRLISTKDLQKIKNSNNLPVMFSGGCSTARFTISAPGGPYLDIYNAEHRGTANGEIFTKPPPPPSPYQKTEYLKTKTSMGEAFLRSKTGGVVAYIGCNTTSQNCAATLLKGLVLNWQNPRLGDSWKNAVSYYCIKQDVWNIKPTKSWYPAAIFRQPMKFMLFGDPSLLLPNEKD